MQMELVLFCLGNKKPVVTVNKQFVKGESGFVLVSATWFG